MSKFFNSKFTLSALAAILSSSGLFAKRPSDHSHRNENRMPLTTEELATLETLSGKTKKAYVKTLRAKYQ